MSHETPNTSHELTQDQQNMDLLRSSELGVLLMDAYITATNLEPRLADVVLKPADDEGRGRFGKAIPSWASESGKHEFQIPLGDLDETLAMYADAMHKVPQGIAIIAERLHIDPSEVTPQLMYVQAKLHEMGHLTEYMDFEANPNDLKHRNKCEKMALPLANVSAGMLVDLESPVRQSVDANWESVSSKLGVGSIDELVSLQAREYRGMTSEAHADSFASDVFDANPQLISQLTNPNLDAYRNYPLAA